ncbi:myb family transcription factor APL-like [Impatiens glandulifera]|uniref:myb family transcription factor APL-like n=1 Tax=Impatiens glandulifera TaxID=253017 RepID=UPI001FB05B7D|nr:myb family transcription factor APL-like [Impatiens glandulifera]
MENHSTPPDVFMNHPSIPYHVPPYQKAPIPKNVLLYQKQQQKLMTKKLVKDHGKNLSLKHRRIRWDADLHGKFVKVVNMLGGYNKATANNIQLHMKVEGLTLSHIKSHLQLEHTIIELQPGSQVNGVHNTSLPNIGFEGSLSATNFQSWNPIPHSYTSYDMQTPFVFGGSIAGERAHEGINRTNHGQMMISNEMIGAEIQQLLVQEQSEREPLEVQNTSLPFTTMGGFGIVANEGSMSPAVFPSGNLSYPSLMSYGPLGYAPNFTPNQHNTYLLGGSVAQERQYEGNIAGNNDNQMMRNQNLEEEMGQFSIQAQVEAESQPYEVHSSSIPYTMMESFGDVAFPSGDPVPPSLTSYDLQVPLGYTPNYSNGNTNLLRETFAGEGEQEEDLAATYWNFDADNVVSL